MKLQYLLLPPLLVAALLFAWTRYGVWQIERDYPPVGQFIETDGTRLHYVLDGPEQAPGILLIHGASSNLRDYSESILPGLAENYRVLAFDRPGLGYSDRVSGDWQNPAELADLLLKAAVQLGIDQPVLLGHSWAGGVVMSALVEHPQRIAGGILLGGVAGHWAGSVGWTYDVGDLPVIGPLFAHLLVYPAGRTMLTDGASTVFAPNTVTQDYVRRIGIPLALRPDSFLHNVQDMKRLSEWLQRLSPRYREIRKPLLAIHGEADELVPFWNHGERLQPVIPHMQVRMLPGVGHAPHHAATNQVIQAIDAFMRDQVQSDQ